MSNYTELMELLSSIRKDSNGGDICNEKSQRMNNSASFYGNYYFRSNIASSSLVPTNNILHTFPSMNISLCEESSSLSQPLPPQKSEEQEKRFQTEYERKLLLRQQLEEKPCLSCKYTGMTVCAGMSLYFLKLALEEATRSATSTKTASATITEAAKTTVATTSKSNNKAFFYIGAVTWAIAGLYRSVLD